MLAANADVTPDHEALIQFLYIAPVGLIQASIDGEIVLINPISAQLLMPLSQDGELTNLFSALESVVPDLRQRIALFDRPHGMVCDAMQIRLTARGGDRTGPQMLSLSVLKLDDHRLMAVLTDITRQVIRDRLLRQNEAWLGAILAGVKDYAVLRLNHEGRIEDWNPSIKRITGFDREAVVGQPFSIFYPTGSTTPDRLLDQLHEAEESGWSLDDGWRIRADGTRFWGSAMISPLHERLAANAPLELRLAGAPEHGEQAYCLVIRDITDKREASERQRRSTSCDLLTGVSNRRAFFEAVEVELARCRWSPRPLSMLKLEVDGFSDVVGSHGLAAADAVLRQLAALMTSVFREVDVVARLGREQFAVLLPSTDLTGAGTVAERLRRMVSERPVEIDGAGSGIGSIRCSISGGIASIESGSVTLDAFLKRADRAFDDAKAIGHDRIACWSVDLHDALA